MIFYTHTMHKRRHVISLPLHTASLHTASLPGILAGIRTATKSCLKITLLVSLAFLPGIFSVLLPIISSPQAYATSGAVTTPSVDITSFAAGGKPGNLQDILLGKLDWRTCGRSGHYRSDSPQWNSLAYQGNQLRGRGPDYCQRIGTGKRSEHSG